MLKLKDIPRTNKNLWESSTLNEYWCDHTINENKFESIRTFDNGKHFDHYLMIKGSGYEGIEINYEFIYNMDDYFY